MTLLTKTIDWFEDKPAFWKYGIGKLITESEISEPEFNEFIKICKQENGLSNVESREVKLDSLKEYVGRISEVDNVSLRRIFNIENINALSESNELPFESKGLNVIYGDNGSGKSSYVGVLKHVCNTRGNLPTITGNLFSQQNSDREKKADVEYSISEKDINAVRFRDGEISDTLLKSVDVFDAKSANHYIEGEDEIAFIPQGLTIIEKFASLLRDAEGIFNEEIQFLEDSIFDFSLLQLVDGTTTKQFVNSINPDTTINELRSQSQFSDKDRDRIGDLQEEIARISAMDPQKKKAQNSAIIGRYKVLKGKLESFEKALIGDSLSEYVTLINDYVASGNTLKDVSERVFSALPLTGVGNDSWIQLWESARKFYNESRGQVVFPETGEDDFCPLCFQELSEDARRRFLGFEDFIKDDVQKKYDAISAKFHGQISTINEISLDLGSYEPTIEEIEQTLPEFRNVLNAYLDVLKEQKKVILLAFSSKSKVERLSSPEIGDNPINVVTGLIAGIEQENSNLEKISITEILKPLKTEYQELLDRSKIFEFRPKIAREICRRKKIERLRKCVGQCNTRNVTFLSNQLASEFITEKLRDNFSKELLRLGFKNLRVETETKGIRGKQYYFLKLDEPNSSSLKLKDILSEGEHRCIALATFFSELSISDHKSAIVFDDPVSSLDHKWRNKIASRIVEESKQRQVVVFTHDITFLMMLQEHSNKLESEINIRSLTRKKHETGIIADNPPWDALPVGKRIGILKSEYQTLEKIERTDTEERYKYKAKFLYGKLRETWERFVEEVFLNGTVQRFGRAIQTQRLKVITDLTDADYSIVESNMEKCSTYFVGHDSAGELIEEMPDSTEFLSDVTVLEDYVKQIRKRRN